MLFKIVEIRRKNLNNWIDSHFEGNQSFFAAQYSLNAGEISGLLRNKSFGEKRARHLEIQVGMPLGYLDSFDDEPNVKKTTPIQPVLNGVERKIFESLKNMSIKSKNEVWEFVKFKLQSEKNLKMSNVFMTTINERIKQKRLELRITQEQLAKKSGLTTSAIGNYESGTRVPKKTLELAIALNVSREWLETGIKPLQEQELGIAIKEIQSLLTQELHLIAIFRSLEDLRKNDLLDQSDFYVSKQKTGRKMIPKIVESTADGKYDIDEIRRLNIRELEKIHGTSLYKKAGMSPTQYYNLRDGAKDSRTGKPRGMRKETAWKLEDAAGVEKGYLNVFHEKQTVKK